MKNGTFLSLVSVENKKLWKRVSTKIVVIILLGLTIFSGVMMKIYSDSTIKQYEKSKSSQTQTTDWKAMLKAENKQLQSDLDAIKDDSPLTVKSQIDSKKMTISENNYRLDNNMAPNTDPKKTDFWKIIFNSSMWQFVALLVIISTSALVAGEFSDNTMKTMISRPFSRNQILSAKLIVTSLFTIEMLAVTYILNIILTLILYGSNGIDGTVLLWLSGKTVALPGFAASLLVLLLDFLSSLVFIIFAFFIATVTRSRAAATGVSIAVLFSSSLFVTLSQHFGWGKFIYLGDAFFSSFLTSGAPFYGVSLSFSLIYCFAWTVLLLIASYVVFEKRDVN